MQTFISFFLILLSFYWSTIALRGCVSFCCTMWVSCMYTYIPYLLDLPHSPTPIPPISVIPEHHRAEIPALYNRSPLAISFTQSSVYTSLLSPNSSHSPFSPHQVSILEVCISSPALQLVHLYHFSRFTTISYVCACVSRSVMSNSLRETFLI